MSADASMPRDSRGGADARIANTSVDARFETPQQPPQQKSVVKRVMNSVLSSFWKRPAPQRASESGAMQALEADTDMRVAEGPPRTDLQQQPPARPQTEVLDINGSAAAHEKSEHSRGVGVLPGRTTSPASATTLAAAPAESLAAKSNGRAPKTPPAQAHPSETSEEGKAVLLADLDAREAHVSPRPHPPARATPSTIRRSERTPKRRFQRDDEASVDMVASGMRRTYGDDGTGGRGGAHQLGAAPELEPTTSVNHLPRGESSTGRGQLSNRTPGKGRSSRSIGTGGGTNQSMENTNKGLTTTVQGTPTNTTIEGVVIVPDVNGEPGGEREVPLHAVTHDDVMRMNYRQLQVLARLLHVPAVGKYELLQSRLADTLKNRTQAYEGEETQLVYVATESYQHKKDDDGDRGKHERRRPQQRQTEARGSVSIPDNTFGDSSGLAASGLVPLTAGATRTTGATAADAVLSQNQNQHDRQVRLDDEFQERLTQLIRSGDASAIFQEVQQLLAQQQKRKQSTNGTMKSRPSADEDAQRGRLGEREKRDSASASVGNSQSSIIPQADPQAKGLTLAVNARQEAEDSREQTQRPLDEEGKDEGADCGAPSSPTFGSHDARFSSVAAHTPARHHHHHRQNHYHASKETNTTTFYGGDGSGAALVTKSENALTRPRSTRPFVAGSPMDANVNANTASVAAIGTQVPGSDGVDAVADRSISRDVAGAAGSIQRPQNNTLDSAPKEHKVSQAATVAATAGSMTPQPRIREHQNQRLASAADLTQPSHDVEAEVDVSLEEQDRASRVRSLDGTGEQEVHTELAERQEMVSAVPSSRNEAVARASGDHVAIPPSSSRGVRPSSGLRTYERHPPMGVARVGAAPAVVVPTPTKFLSPMNGKPPVKRTRPWPVPVDDSRSQPMASAEVTAPATASRAAEAGKGFPTSAAANLEMKTAAGSSSVRALAGVDTIGAGTGNGNDIPAVSVEEGDFLGYAGEMKRRKLTITTAAPFSGHPQDITSSPLHKGVQFTAEEETPARVSVQNLYATPSDIIRTQMGPSGAASRRPGANSKAYNSTDEAGERMLAGSSFGVFAMPTSTSGKDVAPGYRGNRHGSASIFRTLWKSQQSRKKSLGPGTPAGRLPEARSHLRDTAGDGSVSRQQHFDDPNMSGGGAQSTQRILQTLQRIRTPSLTQPRASAAQRYGSRSEAVFEAASAMRPPLPSFGSTIGGKKRRTEELDERPATNGLIPPSRLEYSDTPASSAKRVRLDVVFPQANSAVGPASSSFASSAQRQQSLAQPAQVVQIRNVHHAHNETPKVAGGNGARGSAFEAYVASESRLQRLRREKINQMSGGRPLIASPAVATPRQPAFGQAETGLQAERESSRNKTVHFSAPEDGIGRDKRHMPDFASAAGTASAMRTEFSAQTLSASRVGSSPSPPAVEFDANSKAASKVTGLVSLNDSGGQASVKNIGKDMLDMKSNAPVKPGFEFGSVPGRNGVFQPGVLASSSGKPQSESRAQTQNQKEDAIRGRSEGVGSARLNPGSLFSNTSEAPANSSTTGASLIAPESVVVFADTRRKRGDSDSQADALGQAGKRPRGVGSPDGDSMQPGMKSQVPDYAHGGEGTTVAPTGFFATGESVSGTGKGSGSFPASSAGSAAKFPLPSDGLNLLASGRKSFTPPEEERSVSVVEVPEKASYDDYKSNALFFASSKDTSEPQAAFKFGSASGRSPFDQAASQAARTGRDELDAEAAGEAETSAKRTAAGDISGSVPAGFSAPASSDTGAASSVSFPAFGSSSSDKHGEKNHAPPSAAFAFGSSSAVTNTAASPAILASSKVSGSDSGFARQSSAAESGMRADVAPSSLFGAPDFGPGGREGHSVTPIAPVAGLGQSNASSSLLAPNTGFQTSTPLSDSAFMLGQQSQAQPLSQTGKRMAETGAAVSASEPSAFVADEKAAPFSSSTSLFGGAVGTLASASASPATSQLALAPSSSFGAAGSSATPASLAGGFSFPSPQGQATKKRSAEDTGSAAVQSPFGIANGPSSPPSGFPTGSANPLAATPRSEPMPFGFGAPVSGSSFAGASAGAPVSSGSAFGAPASSGSAFGAPASSGSAFGAPASSGSAFGAPASSGSAFGAPASSGSAFGAPASSGSAFGAPASSGSAFGAPASSGSAFGAPASSGSAFGAPASSGSAFGAPVSSGSAFGAPAASGSGFGSAMPAPSAFGAPAPSGLGFGAPVSSGPAFGVPASSGSAFGSAPAPSIFGAAGASTSAFGPPGSSPSFAFGGAPAAGESSGLFQFGASVAPPTFGSGAFGGAQPSGANPTQNQGGSVGGFGVGFNAAPASFMASAPGGGAAGSLFGSGAPPSVTPTNAMGVQQQPFVFGAVGTGQNAGTFNMGANMAAQGGTQPRRILKAKRHSRPPR
ncbi:Trophinin [Porphyridium purpureum]|uniref:Trophinin n=1 Tax=Porphyridium purpureum TaxID=35688 RepID=A0A5J4Z9G4_PORPP|nr:Trophinin [Porphyridium purpureum]|eukprot:POR3416..scf295_1